MGVDLVTQNRLLDTPNLQVNTKGRARYKAETGRDLHQCQSPIQAVYPNGEAVMLAFPFFWFRWDELEEMPQ